MAFRYQEVIVFDGGYLLMYPERLNCITPLVTAIGNHPAIVCWEIFNEPEGMTTNWGWTPERISKYDVQRFTNRAAVLFTGIIPKPLHYAISDLVTFDIANFIFFTPA